MLIKVGEDRMNLAHVTFIYDKDGACTVYFTNNRESLRFEGEEREQLLNAWDKWAQFQNDAQEMNEFAVAQSLEQIKAAQNKSGIVAPVAAMPLLKRVRG